jgi:hypothetical protein
MQERRLFTRRPVTVPVRVYHPALGSLRDKVEDWSLGGVRVACNEYKPNGHDLGSAYFQLEPVYMDVIFTMEFVRIIRNGLILQFVDDAQAVTGDRL